MAELVREIGAAVGMDYCDDGECGSGASTTSTWGKDLLDAFEDHFRYSDNADDYKRSDYSSVGWFNLIKDQLNLNRPLPYRYEGHAFVCDGWRECSVDASTVCRQYHMNMGWEGTGSDTWYTLDEIPDSPDEKLLTRIYPDCAQGDELSGRNVGLFGVSYAYFNRDALPSMFWPNDVEYIGYNCQFLPGITVGTYPPGGVLHGSPIKFAGTVLGDCRLFSIKGTSAANIKVKDGGTLKLTNGGSIRFH